MTTTAPRTGSSHGSDTPAGPDALLAAVPEGVEVLAPFVQAGVFTATEVHLAAAVARLEPSVDDEVLLALALATRGPRLGHVCVELAEAAPTVVDVDDELAAGLPWPEPGHWAAVLEASPLVAAPGEHRTEPLRPLVWDGRRAYLQRYWQYEDDTAHRLVRRAERDDPGSETLETALDALFGPDAEDLQRQAARRALQGNLAVVAGGPGTGKTRTIARLLATARRAADADGRSLQVALAAPTGKAAARMTDAVRAEVALALADDAITPAQAEGLAQTEATTLHRLLGWAPGSATRFRHDHRQPLPHDLVIVDETSMVSLPMVARLLDAVRPDARLVLVGDPFQLASIEAGTVLGDLVGPHALQPAAPPSGVLAPRTTVLQRVHRFGADSAIAALADAVRSGQVDDALDVLRGDDAQVSWVLDTDGAGRRAVVDEVADAGARLVTAALDGRPEDALVAAQQIKVLAATRHGDLGVYDWTSRVEAAVQRLVPDLRRTSRWYPGRPVMVTANDDLVRVANGDVGVVVRDGDGLAVALPSGDEVRLLPTSRLDAVDTWWAMTIHKSQGSELPHAVVSLPSADSPILTRELLYTAVTRARERVTVVGSEAAIVAAIQRPVARASGLRDRLWPD